MLRARRAGVKRARCRPPAGRVGFAAGEGVLPFETTAARLWRGLAPDERLAAAAAFWKEPPQDMLGAALGAVVRARRLRPQVARSLAPEARARILAGVLEPGEALAAALIVALHLTERRPLLSSFLDAVGLAHEDGLLKDDAAAPALGREQAQAGVQALRERYPPAQVHAYLNTLWLQDPERWAVLAEPPFSD